ncbi:aminotransferase class III-fold pyridoxal phosphate-dependent enzyme, partial [bacterium]
DGLKRLVEKHELVTNARGLGLYQGVTLPTSDHKADAIRVAREEFDLLLLGAGHRSIRTRPNLSVTAEEVDDFLERLDGLFTRIT